MGINPSIPQPGTTPQPGITGPDGQQAPAQTAQPQVQTPGDSLATSEAVQNFKYELVTSGGQVSIKPPDDSPSLLSFLESVGERLAELRQLLNEIEIIDILQGRAVTLAAVSSTIGLNSLHAGILGQHAAWEGLATGQNDEIDQMNGIIENHNKASKGDGKRAFDMNAIIGQFNLGEIHEEQFLELAGEYNNAVQERNQEISGLNKEVKAYNENVKTRNVFIKAMNIDRALVGMPPLPEIAEMSEFPPIKSLDPDARPVSNVSTPSTMSSIEPIEIPDQYQVLMDSYAPIHNAVMINLAYMNDFQELADAYQTLQALNLPGMDIVLPNAFIESVPKVFLQAAIAAGGVTGLAALTGLASSTIERAMALPIASLSLSPVAAANARLAPMIPGTLPSIWGTSPGIPREDASLPSPVVSIESLTLAVRALVRAATLPKVLGMPISFKADLTNRRTALLIDLPPTMSRILLAKDIPRASRKAKLIHTSTAT